MPNHRPVVFLATLSWICAVALAAYSWWSRGLDPELLRAHLTAALALLVIGLLAHAWIFLYTVGVRRELAGRADLVGEDVRVAAASATRARNASLVALCGLVALAGLGVAAQLAWVKPEAHGLGSALVLLVQGACLVGEVRGLEPLRRSLVRLEAREALS
jgi:hypothetical protein